MNDEENEMRQKPVLSTRVWVGILMLLALICLFAWLGMNGNTEPQYAEIYQNGECIRRVPLDEDTVFTVESDDGYNAIEVRGGQIRIVDADCRDQVCVRSGALHGSVPIVCLPHRLVVQGASSASNNTEPEFDAVTG